ncbi:unnamed protein product [Adineta steineri]|uniref:Cytochrome P450 n=2 Tax=Adineta steineri TaxID=433720 RepID=A0A814YKK9_9BILA|nr:unnamed protein product [Adineta steineri]CAF3726988.1 unnamed protein product [Adineta steineri]
MLNILLLITSLLVAIMVYVMKQRYFKRQKDVPGLEPQFLFGNLLQLNVLFSNRSLTDVFKQLHKTYGDIYQYWNGLRSYYVFNKFEHVMHILNSKHMNKYERTDTEMHVFRPFQPNGLEALRGRQHRCFARILYPLFRKSSMPQHTDFAVEKIDEIITCWQERMKDNTNSKETIHTDMKDQMVVLAFHLIISQLCSGYNLQIIGDGKEERERANDMIVSMASVAEHATTILRYSMPETIAYIYLQLCPSYRRAVRVMDKVTNEIVDYLSHLQQQQQEHHELKQQNNDLTDDFEFSKSLKDVSFIDNNQSVSNTSDSNQENTKLPRKVIYDWILSSFGGGYDASAAYAWFIFYMSKYPNVQENIKRELRENDINLTTALTTEIVSQLVYVDCVLKEILRHAPIIEAVTRQVVQPDTVDNVNLSVGDRVLFPLYSFHRNKSIWKHPAGPDAFVPERFLNEDKNYPPQALLTFGGGLRQCFGQHLAQFHLKLFFVRTMQRLSFHDAPGNDGGEVHNITGLPNNLAVYITFEDNQIS